MEKEKEYYRKITDEDLKDVFNAIENINQELAELKRQPQQKVYSNRELQSILGVSDKILKQYRNDDLLSYSRYDDKYWYTQENLDAFMNSCASYSY